MLGSVKSETIKLHEKNKNIRIEWDGAMAARRRVNVGVNFIYLFVWVFVYLF